MRYSHILGVDEAGRGPLAGPVAVGVVKVAGNFDIKKAFPDANDSKQLSERMRETVYAEMKARKKAGEIDFCVRFSSAKLIDAIGITRAVRRGVWGGVRALAPEPALAFVKLDGLLRAPGEYAQETIIKGDALEPVISLASIAAKVERDRLMKKLARIYPGYFLEEHKGYGTKKHYEMIEQRGPTDIHRMTFLSLTTRK
ncbi:MAG TPA: ribonuclease HII [Candidatus Paceibacterota bacterium]|nr:ribonuclease HII [Candidatus Paceibacterota bacterium]